MDRKPKKELIDGIKDFLKDFEEPYDHSEWENFRQHRGSVQRRRISLVVKFASIAASLFLIVYASVRLMPLTDPGGMEKTRDKTPKETLHPSKTKEQQADTLLIDSIGGRELRGGMPPVIHPTDSVKRPDIPNTKISANPIENTGSTIDVLSLERTVKKHVFPTTLVTQELPGPRKLPYGKAGRPLGGNRINFDNISLGFDMSAALTNKGQLYGGGVFLQIPLSTRFYAEMGANYSRMSVGMDLEIDRADTLARQIGMKNTVGMVSIPISLNYVVSDGFSVSLGLSPFRVVNDRRTDSFLAYHRVPGSNPPDDLVPEKSKSIYPDTLYKGNAYLGFIKLSGWVSPPIFRRHNASIAPYMAIPIGGLRNDRYKWVHGGASIKIYLPKIK